MDEGQAILVEPLEAMESILLTGKQVCAFRKLGWRRPVPPAKAREPYDNEVVKRWRA
jgi:hypothetical protein